MEPDLFCFFLSGEKKEVLPGSELWELPLSGKNTGFSSDTPSERKLQDAVITIGDYFLASCRFLSENNFSILKAGLEVVCKRSVLTGQIDRIVVFLEKHGAFYHPLKIQVVVHGFPECCFVLNGAVSKSGLSLLENEYKIISRLNKTHYVQRHLPMVFGVDVITTDKGRIGFFLGEWFDGYKEFHATQDHGIRQVVIWESDGKCHYISEVAAFPIYQEISRILTCYYDIETFDQIFPWHHAAGDFIVRQEAGKVHVRLISVRGYSPLTEFGADEKDKQEHILPSLLLFFLNLLLRMRLDRLNGTGQTVMLGKNMIKPVVEGFLHALDEKSAVCGFGNLRLIFIAFFQQFSLEQVMGIMENILESYQSNSEEIALIKENFESHCRTLHVIFSGF
ncbi:hypothetical protein [Desulfobacula phenolica]|uniref:Uncharacterized protein n=1 Tax=Desulfobacula phenolica TaxID=90732 RepID=A0A1H2DXD8_9BACT|nr:hypothetical protein [Desulfobacula phenolica]SDT87510.1 hypothetical protein SAMN04487931_102296 [Desulfobacula phenolica]